MIALRQSTYKLLRSAFQFLWGGGREGQENTNKNKYVRTHSTRAHAYILVNQVGLYLKGKDRNLSVYVAKLFLNNPFKPF